MKSKNIAGLLIILCVCFSSVVLGGLGIYFAVKDDDDSKLYGYSPEQLAQWAARQQQQDSSGPSGGDPSGGGGSTSAEGSDTTCTLSIRGTDGTLEGQSGNSLTDMTGALDHNLQTTGHAGFVMSNEQEFSEGTHNLEGMKYPGSELDIDNNVFQYKLGDDYDKCKVTFYSEIDQTGQPLEMRGNHNWTTLDDWFRTNITSVDVYKDE